MPATHNRGRETMVREQPVSLIELFYDLVYVYAISKMTSIVSDPGDFGLLSFARYLVSSLVVLQGWLYMTNYVNRFGRERWYENVAIVANMLAAVVMSNALATDWNRTFFSFSLSMLALLGVVAALYAVRLRDGGRAAETAHYSLRTLVPACVMYALVAFVSPLVPGNLPVGLVLGILAVVVGAFGPALVNRVAPISGSVVGFPHLCERFELITIITFGETVVTLGELFEAVGVGAWSILPFVSVICLFGCYVVQMHNLVEHRAVHRALVLMYAHFAIVIAVNLYTVGLNLLVGGGRVSGGVCALAGTGIVLFFAGLLALSIYHRDSVAFVVRDWAVLGGLVAAGAILTFVAGFGAHALFLVGPLLCSGGCFAYFLARDKGLVA